MLTNVTEGYQINTTSLHELTILMNGIRLKAQPLHKEFFLRKVAELSCELLDQSKFYKPSQFKKIIEHIPIDTMQPTPLTLAWATILFHQGLIEERLIHEQDFHFGYSVTLYPQEDCILMKVHTKRKEYVDLLKEFPLVSPYPYWSDHEKQDMVSAKEWEERKERWERTDGVEGLVANLVDEKVNPSHHLDTILEYFPFYPDRLVQWGRKNIIYSKTKEWNSKKTHSATCCLSAQKEKIQEYLESTEGKRALFRERKMLQKCLPYTYSTYDLTAPFLL